MRNKIANLIYASEILCNDCGENSATYCAEAIADHLVKNSVTALPCNVGDAVYCIRYDITRKPYVKQLEVLSITIWCKQRITVFTTKEDAWGETAFRTKEEAEKALKKRGKK